MSGKIFSMCDTNAKKDRLCAGIEAFQQELSELSDEKCLDETQVLALRNKMNELAVRTMYAAMSEDERHAVSLSTYSNDPVQKMVDNSQRSPHVPCLKSQIKKFANTQLPTARRSGSKIKNKYPAYLVSVWRRFRKSVTGYAYPEDGESMNR